MYTFSDRKSISLTVEVKQVFSNLYLDLEIPIFSLHSFWCNVIYFSLSCQWILILFKAMYYILGWHLIVDGQWAFLIKIWPLSVVVVIVVVVIVVVVVVVNFSHFQFLLQNQWTNFIQTWHKPYVAEGNWSLFKWRVPPFSKRRC